MRCSLRDRGRLPGPDRLDLQRLHHNHVVYEDEVSTSQSIQGLIKWSQRGEWRDNFEAALERHVGPACRGAGIGLDELAEIIGDHWMSTLWGCAFEDLVSAGRAERNVADDYLKRSGWKESAGTCAYIEALRRSSMSLYEVSDIVARGELPGA